MTASYLPERETDLATWTTGFAGQVAVLFASIGISSAQSTALNAANATWIAALATAKEDVTRTRGSVAAKNTAKNNVLTLVRQYVGIIQKHPGTTNEMRGDLGITIPKQRQPQGAPGTPNRIKATLDADGTLSLKWKNNDAAGCVYMIYRKLGATGSYVSMGGTGAKRYSDSSIPPGTTQVQYKLQAVRPTGVSDWGILNVTFSTGSGSMTAVESSIKLAA